MRRGAEAAKRAAGLARTTVAAPVDVDTECTAAAVKTGAAAKAQDFPRGVAMRGVARIVAGDVVRMVVLDSGLARP